jgi:hypothetical protein
MMLSIYFMKCPMKLDAETGRAGMLRREVRRKFKMALNAWVELVAAINTVHGDCFSAPKTTS